MKKQKMFLAVVDSICMLGGIDAPISTRAAAVPSPAAATSLDGASCPKAVERNGNRMLVDQPQLKSWQRYRTLVADTAISMTPSAGGKPDSGRDLVAREYPGKSDVADGLLQRHRGAPDAGDCVEHG